MADANERVLVFAPLGRDAEMLAGALHGAGLHPAPCRDADEVVARLTACAALLITEEALTATSTPRLQRALEEQPPWSDVPVVVLTRSGRTAEPSAAALQTFRRLGNVTLLERPLRIMTLVSTLESALRARRRQYEVRDHLAETEAQSRAKDEFLAMLGHELRNPLGALAAATHLVDKTAPAVNDAAVLARRVIARQLRHLTRLVDDLLDVSRVTSGKIELERRPLDVAVAVANCVTALRAAGRVDGHALTVAVRPAWIDADEVRFDQIVSNLIVNAVKYTPAGGRIEVSGGREGDEVVVRVRDNGIGIAPDLLPHVFDLFVQGGRAIERTQGGLGIGLTLVRRLAALHGGVVEGHSDGLGHGSTFCVRLPPLAHPAAAPPPAAPAPAPVLVARRVLVVEDHDDARQMIAVMLADAGHHVYEASDGPGGLEAALRERPDVAIIDVGLPGMNGYEVATRIRASAEGAGMLLVALTGYGLPEDRRRAREAGFDRHLVKPVDFGELTRVLALAA